MCFLCLFEKEQTLRDKLAELERLNEKLTNENASLNQKMADSYDLARVSSDKANHELTKLKNDVSCLALDRF